MKRTTFCIDALWFQTLLQGNRHFHYPKTLPKCSLVLRQKDAAYFLFHKANLVLFQKCRSLALTTHGRVISQFSKVAYLTFYC